MDKRPKMTATERLQEEAAKLGVEVEIVKPVAGSGTLTFLTKRDPDEDDPEK